METLVITTAGSRSRPNTRPVELTRDGGGDNDSSPEHDELGGHNRRGPHAQLFTARRRSIRMVITLFDSFIAGLTQATSRLFLERHTRPLLSP